MALALELQVRTYLSITRAGGLTLVRTYVRKTEWNRTDASVRDLFSIRAMSVRYPFDIRSIVVRFPFS